MPLKPTLTHIALHVADFSACSRFYQDFCGLKVVHQREEYGKTVIWLAEEGKEKAFILVLIPGGPGRNQAENDFSHLGFALESKQAVDAIAAKAKVQHCLWWEPTDHPYPVGYYCGVLDPDGNAVEFSYGQPLGYGARDS
ncbi:MAG: VOC family protein [Pseudomonadales bacterium]